MFVEAGLELVEEGETFAELSGLKENAKYKGLAERDLRCTTLDGLLRKKRDHDMQTERRSRN